MGLAKTRWQKGVSGNPSGRSKAVPEVAEMCRALLPDGVKVLGKILQKSKSDDTRIAAFRALADRGLGKPIQQIDAKVTVFDRMSADEQRAVLRALDAIARDSGAATG